MPVGAYGIQLISMGLLNPGDKPMIWRGPMLHSVMQQFLRSVVWGDLDYLIVDLPPGTGDVQLSLIQTVSLTGAVVVTTPSRPWRWPMFARPSRCSARSMWTCSASSKT